jgi:DNA-binding CsgD family transcriptional regulator
MNPTNQNIIKLLAEGKTAKEVAADLKMNKYTVEKRIRTMKVKYHCLTVTQLVVTVLSIQLDGMGGNA